MKGIINLHRAEEEKPTEIFKAKIKIRREHRSISAFKINQVFFLIPKNNGKKFKLRSSYLTTPWKSARKTDNFSISTQKQFVRELPLLLDSFGE